MILTTAKGVGGIGQKEEKGGEEVGSGQSQLAASLILTPSHRSTEDFPASRRQGGELIN